MASVYASHIHQWAINMEYNVFMPFFFRLRLLTPFTVREHCALFHCYVAFFFLYSLSLSSTQWSRRVSSAVVCSYSCRPFTFCQTCLIIFTMDYFSFLYVHKYAYKTVALLLFGNLFPYFAILLSFASVYACIQFFFSSSSSFIPPKTSLAAWFYNVCHMCGHLGIIHTHTIFGGSFVLPYNAALFD